MPLYSLSVALANDRFEPHEMVRAAGAVVIYYGIGNPLGPVLGSQFMRWVGPAGLFLSMTLVLALSSCLCAHSYDLDSRIAEASYPLSALSQDQRRGVSDASQGSRPAQAAGFLSRRTGELTTLVKRSPQMGVHGRTVSVSFRGFDAEMRRLKQQSLRTAA